MNKPENSNSALSGERVLDLTDGRGTFCARLLADMGADVIRVNKTRESLAISPFFVASNLGKRSVTLNLEVKAGQELFRRLVQTADILVESYTPGYLEALGLGYTGLSQINPRLILASITNFGQNGPYRDYKSDDMVAAALGGQMSVCGEPELPPLKPFGQQPDSSAGLFSAIGILLALWQRHTTGRGQHIDISRHECVAATLDHVLVRYFYEGVVAKRQDSLYWNNAFRIFPCRDGHIMLSIFHQWATLVEWLEAEGMAQDLTDEKWRGREVQIERLDHIIGVLEQWTKSHTVAELVEKGQLMRFPWAEVTPLPQLLASPQLEERNFFIEVEHPESGERYKFPGAPCKLSRSPWRVGSHIAASGEHNMEVYHGELGLAELAVEALIKEGTI